MKVLTISATDKIGGAGIASYRLHQALLWSGLAAEMLVWRKVTADPTVHRLAGRLNRWQRARRRLAERRHRLALDKHARKAGSAYWSLNHRSYPVSAAINSFAADLVHLHWIGDNFLPIAEFAKIKAPIVWTLHDMWAFTGGCHYAGACHKYREACGNCPQLAKPGSHDISAGIVGKKQGNWAQLPLTVVCPSQWLADCARQSAVLKGKNIEVVANPIDRRDFKPLDKLQARRAFNLPPDKKLVLFGAFGGTADPRKGFAHLKRALSGLSPGSNIELVVFGAERAEALDLALPLHQVGQLRDTVSLSLLYSASDLFVLPALQDNLPNTLMEALACGTPCAAFDTGGVSDLLQHQQNGYLAKLKDPDDLQRGIQWVLAQDWFPWELHKQTVDRYSLEGISEQYIRLYRTLIGNSNSRSHQETP